MPCCMHHKTGKQNDQWEHTVLLLHGWLISFSFVADHIARPLWLRIAYITMHASNLLPPSQHMKAINAIADHPTHYIDRAFASTLFTSA